MSHQSLKTTLAIMLIGVAVLARLLPHVPNFSPVLSVGLFAGVYLGKWRGAAVVAIIQIISNLYFGYSGMVWSVTALMVALSLASRHLRCDSHFVRIFSVSAIQSLAFFFISNFLVWIEGLLYPLTLMGLAECYTLALPFYPATLISNMAYTGILFGGMKLAEKRLFSCGAAS